MEFYLWLIIGILLCIIAGLVIRLHLLRKSALEIDRGFAERLTIETNTLISISSRDSHMRKLAADINVQLGKLRSERRRFQQGDLELKNAITNISHDLRTPLTAIYGYLTLLEQEEKSETVQRYLSMIENRIHMLKRLTEELFRYSVAVSVKELDCEWIDLRRILEESLLSFYGSFQQQNITPDISLPEQRIRRFLDPAAVSRIFSNIISNALKYSDGDFAVRMDIHGTITFSNTSKKMTRVTAEKLFDKFYTIETGQEATGLGLSIARLLTDSMGGSIRADYKTHRLTITVSFPPESPAS
ncbi:HAMP domain-containing sensor histidine kinase [Lachnospiraceae bacterium 46-15]